MAERPPHRATRRAGRAGSRSRSGPRRTRLIDAGDIYLADLNEERRRRVLVASSARFTRASGRVLVVPEILGRPDDVPFPWRIEVDGAVFAVDFLRAIPVDCLLDRIDRAPHHTMVAVRRALLHIC